MRFKGQKEAGQGHEKAGVVRKPTLTVWLLQQEKGIQRIELSHLPSSKIHVLGEPYAPYAPRCLMPCARAMPDS